MDWNDVEVLACVCYSSLVLFDGDSLTLVVGRYRAHVSGLVVRGFCTRG